MAGVIFQVVSAAILHFNCLNFGLTIMLPSSTMMIFMSQNTTLNRPMTDTEGSLLSSLSSIGAIISAPFTGIMMDRLGRKRSSIINAVIGTFSWSLLAMSKQVEVVLTSAFIAGISGSIFLVVPVYVSEFSEDSIRGTLTSGAVVFYGIGMLLSFLLGGYLEYTMLVYVCLTMSSIGVALLVFLRESPTCLMKKGMEEEAAKAMAFYRHDKPNSKVVVEELEKIKRALAPESEEMTTEEERLTTEFVENTPKEKLSCWQFFKHSRSTRRAFLISMTLMTFAIFQGMAIVQIYAKPLFTEAIPEEVLSATWCSVILAAVSVISGLVTAYLTDVTGRRTLMINASTAAGVCCFALGTQVHLHWGPHWLTAVFIYMFCATYTMGAGTVPFLLLAELFLPEVRGILSMLVMEWTWVCSFVALFIFSPLVTAIGLGPVFYFFAGVCFVSSVFCYFLLPETKGLTVDAIQLLLVPRKSAVV